MSWSDKVVIRSRIRIGNVTAVGVIIPLVLTAQFSWCAAASGAARSAVTTGCASHVLGDVNGDGHAEAVVSEPHYPDRSGVVHVFYGQASGLVADATGTALDDQSFAASTPGVPPTTATDEDFGASNVLADFNGDGCADLAVGAPDGVAGGRVVILSGSPRGLLTAGGQSITSSSVTGQALGGNFGTDLSAGDFNGDGVADLAVGAPGSGAQTGGGVAVAYGAAGGLGRGATGSTWITQATPGVPGTPEPDDVFGDALAVGDFDGDEVADLAVGVPGEDDFAGIVQVMKGREGSGVDPASARSYSQDSPGVAGKGERFDGFGLALAAGDATGDGRADLAVGAPEEDGFASGESAGQGGKGAVTFLPGTPSGLTGQGSQMWTQDSPEVTGIAERSDYFGSSLVMAPLDDGPRFDLAIGSPSDSVGVARSCGSVTVLLGARTGLTTAGAGGRRLSQDSAGVSGTAEANDQFGQAVGAARVQTPGRANLLIGVPQESVGGNFLAGLFHQLAASGDGPTGTGSRTFSLDTPGVKGTSAGGETQFGRDVG